MRKAAISPPSKVLSEFYVKCRSYSVMRLVYIALVSRTGAVNSPSLIRRTVNGRTKPIRAVTVIFFGSFHKSAICSCIVGGLHFFHSVILGKTLRRCNDLCVILAVCAKAITATVYSFGNLHVRSFKRLRIFSEKNVFPLVGRLSFLIASHVYLV